MLKGGSKFYNCSKDSRYLRKSKV